MGEDWLAVTVSKVKFACWKTSILLAKRRAQQVSDRVDSALPTSRGMRIGECKPLAFFLMDERTGS